MTNGLQPDLELLAKEPDFSQKVEDLEKFKLSEMKKFERSNRAAVQEFEDLFQ